MIEIENIKFAYQQEQPIINKLSLSIHRGETIGLVGANGAGKSTLLKLLVGLNLPVHGTIQIAGIPVNKKTLDQVRKMIGFAFQDADSQLFMTTVYEDVAFGPRNLAYSELEVDALVTSALEQVDALQLATRPPYKLSGGEKRRVAIATVLSMKPEIIILDEPAIGLDPKSRRGLISLLDRLEQTKIIATHDMDMALELCDRVVVMHEGQIEMIGQPVEIFRNRKLLERCNLEQPLAMQGCSVCNGRDDKCR